MVSIMVMLSIRTS